MGTSEEYQIITNSTFELHRTKTKSHNFSLTIESIPRERLVVTTWGKERSKEAR